MRAGKGHICHHCGADKSPCWRKGPEDKPILCNACGARYLVKRSLAGYRKCVNTAASGSKTDGHNGSGAKRSAGKGSKRKADRGASPRSAAGSEPPPILVDRGTQTLAHIPLFLPICPQKTSLACQEAPNLFTLSPSKHRAMSEEDFSSFAVPTLTLLRQSDSNSDSAETGVRTPTPVVRSRPRKGLAIRALF